MNAVVVAFIRRWRRTHLLRFAFFGVALSLLQTTLGHDLYTAYVQHRLRLTASKEHLDLIVELTFFEEWSARERSAMDTDANGHISRAELEAYLKKQAPELEKQVSVAVGSHRLPLTVLYEPEMDLLGSDTAGPAHHILRLFFFAPTPRDLRGGEELLIEDRLWPEAKALGTVEANGRDGCILEPEKRNDPNFLPALPSEARAFKIKCLKPPKFPPAVAKPGHPAH